VRKKVLVIAMLDSVHLARWLHQFSDQPIDFVLFPSSPHRRIHTQLKILLTNQNLATFNIISGMKLLALPLTLLDLLVGNRIRGQLIRILINRSKVKFDVLHAHETQHAGYLTEYALRNSKLKPQLFLSIWGSDLYWFMQFKRHRLRIADVLAITNQLIIECRRDIPFANDLGYKGQEPILSIASGGFSNDTLNQVSDALKPSERKIILIKGYMGFVGRADIALEVIYEIRAELHDYTIVIYSTDVESRSKIRQLRRNSSLNIIGHKKHTISHQGMMSLFCSARIHIGVSASDGMPGSLREAMVSGCFPIQTESSCANEWIEDGRTGFIFSLNDRDKLKKSILKSISDDILVDNAAVENQLMIKKRLNNVTSQGNLLDLYTN